MCQKGEDRGLYWGICLFSPSFLQLHLFQCSLFDSWPASLWRWGTLTYRRVSPVVLSQPPSPVPRTRSLWSPLRGGRRGGVRNRRRERSCPQRRVSFKSLHFSSTPSVSDAGGPQITLWKKHLLQSCCYLSIRSQWKSFCRMKQEVRSRFSASLL